MDWPLFSTGMTDTWRKGRKMLDGSLRPSALISYRQLIEEMTRGFLVQLQANPKGFRSHIRRSVGCPLISCNFSNNGQIAIRKSLPCQLRMAMA